MCGEGSHSVEGEGATTERRLLRWRDILENAGGQHPIDGLCSRDPVLRSTEQQRATEYTFLVRSLNGSCRPTLPDEGKG